MNLISRVVKGMADLTIIGSKMGGGNELMQAFILKVIESIF